jgi:myo-inositol 2-dehydrogenase/D-chiro-inositol 1-dehydrogenase
LRVGFVGCGRATADLHLPAFARLEGVEAVALADVDPDRARDVARRFGVPRVHDGAEALAADDRVDLVAVCSPPRTHAAAAHAALAAGRHVFVEKPLTLDPAEADELVDAAEASGRTAAVGFNLRLHRQVRAARAALAEGRLGRLLMVRTHWTAGPRPAGWRASAEQGGAALWEMGIHHLDLWRVLAGEPREVRASGDDHALVLGARTDDGVTLATTVAAGTSDANEVELVGERGRLTLTLYRGDGPHWAPLGAAAGGPAARARAALQRAAALPRQARSARAGGEYLATFAAEWEAVRAAVRAGAPVHATLADGRAAVALAFEAEHGLAGVAT